MGEESEREKFMLSFYTSLSRFSLLDVGVGRDVSISIAYLINRFGLALT